LIQADKGCVFPRENNSRLRQYEFSEDKSHRSGLCAGQVPELYYSYLRIIECKTELNMDLQHFFKQVRTLGALGFVVTKDNHGIARELFDAEICQNIYFVSK